jgi:hypothetical protein
MPFANDFTEVYEQFFRPCLEEAGFAVSRADDLTNQRSIMHDVVAGLLESDLVVADLTDANPNVYYELGIAHAGHRRVVLLTQGVGEVPFDLQGYRLIPYDTHFARIKAAWKKLHEIAAAARNQEAEFGSPVSDYHAARGRRRAGHSPSSESVPVTEFSPGEPGEAKQQAKQPESSSDDEPGQIDLIVESEQGFEKVSSILTELTERTKAIGQATEETTRRITVLKDREEKGWPREVRQVTRELGATLADYGTFVAARNADYDENLATLSDRLEALLVNANYEENEARMGLESFLGTLTEMEAQARGALTNVLGYAEAVKGTRKAERQYRVAADLVVRELGRFADNLSQTISMIVRIRDIGQQILFGGQLAKEPPNPPMQPTGSAGG